MQGLEGGSERAGEWRAAHEQLLRLAAAQASLEHEEGRWLLVAVRARTHVELGYGSFVEYVDRLFGYGPRLTYEKLRVAEALEGLPATGEALRDGRVNWSAVRELTRVALPGTEREWLAAAEGRTAREVERLVSGHKPGDRPGDPKDSALERHVLRFEVTGETLATLREALRKIRQDAGEALDDDAALLLLARQALHGPTDEGRASYQVLMTICERCGRGWQQGGSEPVEVGADVVASACCDAQHLGATHVGNGEAGEEQKPARASQGIPPAVRREVMRRDGHRCVFPGCRHTSFVDVHHLKLRENGGKHDVNNLAVLCGAHHRAIHRGIVMVRGTVATGLRFEHADGTPYGQLPAAAEVSVRARVFQALRRLRFRETEARQTLERIGLQPGATVEQLLRQCLHELSREALGKAS